MSVLTVIFVHIYKKYRFTFISDTIENTYMSRLFKVILISLFLASSSLAGSDGQNELSKNQ